MSNRAKHIIGIVAHVLVVLLGLVVMYLGLKQEEPDLLRWGAIIATGGLGSLGVTHLVLAHLGGAASQVDLLGQLIQFLPPQYRGAAKLALGDTEAGLKELAAVNPPAPPPPVAGFARLGLLVGLLFGGAVLLVGLPARADTPAPDPGGCFGFAQLHCGAPVSFLSLQLDGSLNVQPSIGPGIDWHFRAWDLGAAWLNGGAYNLVKGTTKFSGQFVPFATLGEPFGYLHGAGVGAGVDLYGDEGGLFKGWTWRKNFRVMVTGSPDLTNALQSIPAIAHFGQLPVAT